MPLLRTHKWVVEGGDDPAERRPGFPAAAVGEMVWIDVCGKRWIALIERVDPDGRTLLRCYDPAGDLPLSFSAPPEEK